jgi:peptidoglycan/xylan/chitin deacetylase (PgdA/CDA1 family)
VKRNYIVERLIVLMCIVLLALIVGMNHQEEVASVSKTEDAPVVAITFDDGPHETYTPILLEGLKQRNVKATFFVIGESAKAHPELIKQMVDEGHLVGSHTYSHVQLTKLSIDKAEEEIDKANEAIYEACNVYPKFIRPPYGSWNETLEEKTDMNAVLWSVDPYDWKVQNTDTVVKRVLEDVKDGSIILLHDIYKTSVDAALQIIDALQQQGYLFATVEELQID